MINRREAFIWIVSLWAWSMLSRCNKIKDLTDTILGQENMKANSSLAPEYQNILDKAKRDFEVALLGFWVPQEAIKNILNSIVVIDIWDWIWTGFFISNNMILTAGHVISDSVDGTRFNYSKPSIPDSIHNLDGEKYKGIKVDWDSDNDIWYIIVSKSGKWKLNVWNEVLTTNTDRLTIGFGWKQWHITEWKVTRTFWSKPLPFRDWEKIETVSNPIIKWDSWSPVLDRNGDVRWITIEKFIANVNQKIQDDKTGVSFPANIRYGWIEPLDDIKDFLSEITLNPR